MRSPQSTVRRSKRRSPLPEPQVRDRMMVIYHRRDSLWGWTRVQGLFSEYFAVLGALKYAEQHGAAGVRVWFDSEVYRDERRGPNWWAHFFAETMLLTDAAAGAKEVHYRGWHRFGPYAWNESWTTQIYDNTNLKPYPIDAEDQMRDAARLTARYIKVQPAVLAEVERFKAAHVAPDEFLIGLHFRGTDKVIAFPYRIPAMATYQAAIERVLAEYRPARYRLLVATDQVEFVEWARATYGDRVIVPDAPRLSGTDEIARRQGTHKDARIPSHLKGIAAVRDCLLLARCDYLIKNRSGLSDASLAFNPRIPWTFIFSDTEVSHHPPVNATA